VCLTRYGDYSGGPSIETASSVVAQLVASLQDRSFLGVHAVALVVGTAERVQPVRGVAARTAPPATRHPAFHGACRHILLRVRLNSHDPEGESYKICHSSAVSCSLLNATTAAAMPRYHLTQRLSKTVLTTTTHFVTHKRRPLDKFLYAYILALHRPQYLSAINVRFYALTRMPVALDQRRFGP
jgi:hypothetical protein